MKKFIGVMFLILAFVGAQVAVYAQEKTEKPGEKMEKKGEKMEKKGEAMEA